MNDQAEAVRVATSDRSLDGHGDVGDAAPRARQSVRPQACAACAAAADHAEPDQPGTTAPSFVYAIGKVEARFPNLAVEKEFAQATGQTDTAGLTDRQAFHAVLAQRENRYLARQICWVFGIGGLDTYLLVPRDPADLDLLVEAVRPTPGPNDIDVVIGLRGPIAPPEMCNGLMIPIIAFDQIYSFDRDALIQAIPRPPKLTAAQFAPAAEQVFDRIIQLTDNSGSTDEHRALNYLAMRYPAIYAKAAEQFGQACAMTGVEVRPSRLSGTRTIVDVIFSYTNRNTGFIEKFVVTCDATYEFPFLVTRMSPYYDR